MSRLGANVDQLDAMARELHGYADRVQGVRESVASALARTAWTGPEAEAFRRRWYAVSVRSLDGFSGDLTSAADELRRQADEQRATSARTVTLTSGGMVPGSAGAIAQTIAADAGGFARAGIAGSGGTPLWIAGIGYVLVNTSPGILLGRAALDHVRHDPWGAITEATATALEFAEIPTNLAREGFAGHAGTVLSVGSAAIGGAFDQFERDAGRTDLSTVEKGLRTADSAVLNGGLVFGAAALGGTFAGPVGAWAMGAATSHLLDTEIGQSVTGGVVEVSSAVRTGTWDMLGTVGGEVWDMHTDPDWSPMDALHNIGAAGSEAAEGIADAGIESATSVIDAVGGTVTGVAQDAQRWADTAGDVVDGAADAAGDIRDTVRGWF